MNHIFKMTHSMTHCDEQTTQHTRKQNLKSVRLPVNEFIYTPMNQTYP